MVSCMKKNMFRSVKGYLHKCKLLIFIALKTISYIINIIVTKIQYYIIILKVYDSEQHDDNRISPLNFSNSLI
jgi:hypothetical protein